jgi:membrane protease YdiL (CAAX protease family)
VVLFIVVDKVVAESVLAVPLIAAKYATGGLLAGKPMTERVLMDPAGLGVPLWSFFWGLIGWGSLLVTLGLTAALAHWLEKRSLGELGLRPQGRMARDLLAGLGLAAVFFVSVAGVGAARGLYTVHFAAPDADAAAIAGVGFILLLPFAAVEEISMRGYVLNAASRSWGKAGGLAASTLLFAGLHGFNPHFKDQPLALAGLLLAGLYLGSAYLITGNLWFPIFLHTGWNLLEGPVFGFPVSGNALSISIFHSASTGPKLWTGGSFGPEAGLLLCLLMAVHIAALWAMSPALRPRGPAAEPPAGGEAPSRVEAEASYRAIPIR